MKHLLLLILTVFIGTWAYSQGIPEKANTIIITLPDSNQVQEKVLKALSDRDFPVTKPAKGATRITPGVKTVKNNTRVGLTADIKGAEVILTGKIIITGQGNLNIEYKGSKGTPIMNAWEEMDKVAKALGGKIKYEVK